MLFLVSMDGVAQPAVHAAPDCVTDFFAVGANALTVVGARRAAATRSMHNHPMSEESVVQAFLAFSRHTLVEQCWPRLRGCVETLTDDQVWWRPNEASNSIGNLLLHLSGNVRQWIVTPFTGAADRRDRPGEFDQRNRIARATLLDDLGATIRDADRVLASLSGRELAATLNIQGYTVTGLHAVYHVVEHFSMHYGQVLYVAKQLRGEDLGFYRHLDKTGQAE